MHQNHFWNLLAKKLAGEASEEDLLQLEEYIKANSKLTYSAQHITDLWDIPPATTPQQTEEAYQKHLMFLQQQDNALAESLIINDLYPDGDAPYKKRISFFHILVVIILLGATAILYFFLILHQ